MEKLLFKPNSNSHVKLKCIQTFIEENTLFDCLTFDVVVVVVICACMAVKDPHCVHTEAGYM